MNTPKPLSEKEIINRILSGESIVRIHKTSGMTSPAIYSVLHKNRIDYKELLIKRRTLALKEKTKDPKPMNPYFYILYTHEDAQKRLTDAMVSDANRVGNIVNRCPRRRDLLLHGHFKPVDILNVYDRFSILMDLVRSSSPEDSERFLTEEEIIVQYNLFCKKVKDCPEDKTAKNLKTRHSRKDPLLAQLKELAHTLGRTPLKTDLNASLYMKCYRYFGSLADALEAAEMVPAMVLRKARAKELDQKLQAEKKSVIENVKNLRMQLGRNPLPEEIEPGIAYAETKLGKCYPDFATVCRVAGFTDNYMYKGSFYTVDQLLEMVRNLAAVLGRVPTHKDLRKHLPVNYMSFHRRFGSLGRTLLAAGVIDQTIFEIKYMPHIEKTRKKVAAGENNQELISTEVTL